MLAIDAVLVLSVHTQPHSKGLVLCRQVLPLVLVCQAFEIQVVVQVSLAGPTAMSAVAGAAAAAECAAWAAVAAMLSPAGQVSWSTCCSMAGNSPATWMYRHICAC